MRSIRRVVRVALASIGVDKEVRAPWVCSGDVNARLVVRRYNPPGREVEIVVLALSRC